MSVVLVEAHYAGSGRKRVKANLVRMIADVDRPCASGLQTPARYAPWNSGLLENAKHLPSGLEAPWTLEDS